MQSSSVLYDAHSPTGRLLHLWEFMEFSIRILMCTIQRQLKEKWKNKQTGKNVLLYGSINSTHALNHISCAFPTPDNIVKRERAQKHWSKPPTPKNNQQPKTTTNLNMGKCIHPTKMLFCIIGVGVCAPCTIHYNEEIVIQLSWDKKPITLWQGRP